MITFFTFKSIIQELGAKSACARDLELDCGFQALAGRPTYLLNANCSTSGRLHMGIHMRKLIVVVMATVAMFGMAATLGGCAAGKGKAPVVTKG